MARGRQQSGVNTPHTALQCWRMVTERRRQDWLLLLTSATKMRHRDQRRHSASSATSSSLMASVLLKRLRRVSANTVAHRPQEH